MVNSADSNQSAWDCQVSCPTWHTITDIGTTFERVLYAFDIASALVQF